MWSLYSDYPEKGGSAIGHRMKKYIIFIIPHFITQYEVRFILNKKHAFDSLNLEYALQCSLIVLLITKLSTHGLEFKISDHLEIKKLFI